MMDPQERLFLQTCWETVEDAGYTPRTLVAPQGRHRRHPVGVFVGVMHKDYTLLGADAAAQGHRVPLSLNYAQIANRVSYHCNFHGPSMAIDTVCSSSLTAVHLAVESIRRGECQVALAGGVNLSLHPQKYLTYGSWDMHSSDGRCRTFGQGGDGYVSAEGIGAVLLKPLRQAEQDGDRIYAVIKGSAINHVGMVSGISVPSPVAQADAIEQCLEQSGIDPRTISYVDAHGTGTSLGDPIEIQGLVKAFSQRTQEKQFCAIGSVKSNIGHAEFGCRDQRVEQGGPATLPSNACAIAACGRPQSASESVPIALLCTANHRSVAATGGGRARGRGALSATSRIKLVRCIWFECPSHSGRVYFSASCIASGL